MGSARKRFRFGTAGIGFAVASTLIFGQAGAAHAPVSISASRAPAIAAAATLSAVPAAASSGAQYSAEPFRKLNVKVPAASLRLIPAMEDGSYATLALGPIRYPDGAVTLPGRLKVMRQQAKQPDVTEVGHGVSVPTGIILAEAFNAYPSDKKSDTAGNSSGFGGLPLVTSAHAAAPGSAALEAMGGPLNRLPVEGHVLFVEDDDALSSGAQTQLDKVVKLLRKSHASLDVVAYGGNRESRSSDARRLSLRRGLAVRAYLVSRGIDQKRISIRPMGGVRDDGPQQRVDVFYASY